MPAHIKNGCTKKRWLYLLSVPQKKPQWIWQWFLSLLLCHSSSECAFFTVVSPHQHHSEMLENCWVLLKLVLSVPFQSKWLCQVASRAYLPWFRNCLNKFLKCTTTFKPKPMSQTGCAPPHTPPHAGFGQKLFWGPVHTAFAVCKKWNTLFPMGVFTQRCRQHQRICLQICVQTCLRVLCERGLKGARTYTCVQCGQCCCCNGVFASEFASLLASRPVFLLKCVLKLPSWDDQGPDPSRVHHCHPVSSFPGVAWFLFFFLGGDVSFGNAFPNETTRYPQPV